MKTVYPLKIQGHLRPMLIGFRKANRLTQKELSTRLGVTQQTYACLEANPASASFDRLFKVFSILGVEIDLSSREPLLQTKSELTTQQYSTLPARQEKW
ncbi:helix-turn-helix transcriptional regulator [Enterobacter ludwigii]|uniref:helix-turn-helix transcriptional regulator n=1 Tax=Enterobacter ludwigii TaxID=299767 RepID=UPI00159C1388|nr:helix-turn-helix transcriptional regulator [Enterobacter ludwigii]QLA06929.1 helix-turn-helix transcriptional regulator [Enterobacter ludwigii]